MQSEPFEFWKVAFLVEVLPLRAKSLGQLLTGVTLAPDISILYHLHQQFFRAPDRLPDYPNDFATWANNSLGDALVAERLADLNLIRSAALSVVRREISVILAEHLQEHGDTRRAQPGSEFIFCRLRLVSFGTGHRASTPEEFVEVLRSADSDSIGYHLFGPKVSAGKVANDFASWFRKLGHQALARQLGEFDPYLNSLEDNRAYLIELIEQDMRRQRAGGQT
jgi:hypothetical protein